VDEHDGDEGWMVSNEFSSVIVELDHTGRSPRLRLVHRISGREIRLDALQLEALVSLTTRQLWDMLDPSDLADAR
jgi:hypothetical protein